MNEESDEMIDELLNFAEYILGEYDVCKWDEDDDRFRNARKTPERLVIEFMLSKEKK